MSSSAVIFVIRFFDLPCFWAAATMFCHEPVFKGTAAPQTGTESPQVNVHSDFSHYSEPELHRWLHLRAIEWYAWPVFLSQPLLPLLIISFPVVTVLLVVFACDLVWRFVRYPLASPRLASMGANFVIILKWPCSIGAAIYLCVQHRYGLALLAILWPFVASIVSLPGSLLWALVGRPPQVGAVELQLAKRIGYVHPDATLFPNPIT